MVDAVQEYFSTVLIETMCVCVRTGSTSHPHWGADALQASQALPFLAFFFFFILNRVSVQCNFSST